MTTQHTSLRHDDRPSAASSFDDEAIEEILHKYDGNPGALIAILGEIQHQYGYLPEEILRMVSEKTGRALVDVYGIVTFYRSFSLKPRGRHHLRVCLGTACHVRGAPRIAEEFERQLGINGGETTPDGQFTLETVNCLGACALGPVAVIDGRYFSKVRKGKVRELLDRAREGFEREEGETDGRRFSLPVSCPHCNHSLLDEKLPLDGYPSICLSVLAEGRQGHLHLSSLFGSRRFFAAGDLPPDGIQRFFCPHCHGELVNGAACPQCNTPLISMLVQGGGMFQLCSRPGCTKTLLDLA